MALRDLTPQMRTRMNHVERAVGLLVVGAASILFLALGLYIRQAAIRHGWFLEKIPYYIYVQNATGLDLGDPVKMMGFDIGRITAVQPTEAGNYWFVTNRYNVFVQFEVVAPNFGYIWSDSVVKVQPGDLLGKRFLEVIKGHSGSATVLEQNERVVGLLSADVSDVYEPVAQSKGVWLTAEEDPPVTERLSTFIHAAEQALPALTNRLTEVLIHGSQALSNANILILDSRTSVAHVGEITDRLRGADGALGRWLVSSNFPGQLETTLGQATSALGTADRTLSGVDTNLAVLVQKLAVSLDNLGNITSNLNTQVESNTNILSDVSKAVRDLDDLVQGLKRHWFLKSAFRTQPQSPPPRPQPSRRDDPRRP
jgi:ABC-type transporter Mla subunit MlaD